MAQITKPFTFSTGGTIIAGEHNQNYDTLYNDFNGNIQNTNFSGSAAIPDSKLATISSAGKVDIDSLTIGSQAQGDLLYASGAATWARLGAGTDKMALETKGTGANPEWSYLEDFKLNEDGASATTFSVTTPTGAVTVTVPDEDINLPEQLVKGWATFDGTGASITIDDGYNIDSSVTDNGTGDYTIAFTTNFASANYALGGTAQSAGTGAWTVVQFRDKAGQAAGTARIQTRDDGNNLEDSAIVSIMAIGNQ